MVRLAECLLERETLDGVEIRRIVAGLALDEVEPGAGSRQRRRQAAVERAFGETAEANPAADHRRQSRTGLSQDRHSCLSQRRRQKGNGPQPVPLFFYP